jgi:hypothetical protein
VACPIQVEKRALDSLYREEANMANLISPSILRALIVSEFKKLRDAAPPRTTPSMVLTFSTSVNDEVEDGYRYADLVIRAPTNYVQVWGRARWNVIPAEDLEDDGDGSGDCHVKPGKDYTQGATEWKMLADHDSGWTDGIDRFLREHEILTLQIHPHWYRIADPIQG